MKQKKVLIVAHPDDEIIFFSSILKIVDKIIVCFGTSSDNTITEGRKLLQIHYPFQNIEWLNLDETDTYLASNWNKPIPTVNGVKVNRNKSKYNNMYDQLCDIFKKKLAPYDIVYTHNPWGEYGHEEHVSVFNSVQNSIFGCNKKLFVSCYVSDRSEKLYLKQKHILKGETQQGIISKKFCAEIKNLYIKYNCWTWDDNYEWPYAEFFLEVQNYKFLNTNNIDILTANSPIMFFSKSYKKNTIRTIISKNFPKKIIFIIKSIFLQR
jgi:LmbE family N-acetylglucosaminyl deacetylase